MKKYLKVVFVFLFVIAFNSVHQCFAQEMYDFSAIIQIKAGKKEIKEEVTGTVNVTTNEEEFMKKVSTPSHHGDPGYDGSTFKTVFNFEFGSEYTECEGLLDKEGIEVKTFPQDNNAEGEPIDQVRLEFDQKARTKVVERILEKYGETVRDTLDLDDGFSATSPYPGVIILLREVKLVEMPEFTG